MQSSPVVSSSVMKLILLSGCILLWACQEAFAAFPPMVITACVREHKTKAVDLALFYGTDMNEATQPVKCYLTCLFESSGFTINGEVSPSIIAMTEGTPPNPAAGVFFDIVKSCKDVKSNVDCELGFLLIKCFADYGKTSLLHMTPTEETDVNN